MIRGNLTMGYIIVRFTILLQCIKNKYFIYNWYVLPILTSLDKTLNVIDFFLFLCIKRRGYSSNLISRQSYHIFKSISLYVALFVK